MKLTKGQKVLIEVEIAESEPDAYGEIYVIPQRAKELDLRTPIRVTEVSIEVPAKEKKSKLPKCPHCKVELRPIYYKGYYDQFSCWECACEKIPDAEEERGGYV